MHVESVHPAVTKLAHATPVPHRGNSSSLLTTGLCTALRVSLWKHISSYIMPQINTDQGLPIVLRMNKQIFSHGPHDCPTWAPACLFNLFLYHPSAHYAQVNGSRSVVPRPATPMLPGTLLRNADFQTPSQTCRITDSGLEAQRAVAYQALQ